MSLMIKKKHSSVLIFSEESCYEEVHSTLFCLAAQALAETVLFSLEPPPDAENISLWRKLHHSLSRISMSTQSTMRS